MDKTSRLVGHRNNYVSTATIPETINGPLWPILFLVLCCVCLVVSAVSQVFARGASSISAAGQKFTM